MSGNKYRTVTITRTNDIEVRVGFRPGLAQSWHEPGEPEEWWIEGATDDDDKTIELTDAEKDQAVEKAANEIEQGPPDEPDPDPDPEDEHKPF